PHQIFRQAFFSLAENPSFPASPPLLQRKKSTTPPTMAPKGNKGKKKITFNPEIPPVEGDENLGSIFAAAQAEIEAEPSSSATTNPSKRPRSNTISSLCDYQPVQDPFLAASHRYP